MTSQETKYISGEPVSAVVSPDHSGNGQREGPSGAEGALVTGAQIPVGDTDFPVAEDNPPVSLDS